MGKSKDIDQITNILSTALRHKIGSLLGRDKEYFRKYEIEFSARKRMAEKILKNCNFNNYDKNVIKNLLRKKLKKELDERDYIKKEKFEIMEKEIEELLKELILT